MVNSQLVDVMTGDIFSPLDKYYKKDKVLPDMEIEVSRLVSEGNSARK